MAVYTVNGGAQVGETWVTLPTPTAAAWVQSRRDCFITTRATPNVANAMVLRKDVPFPIKAGSAGVRVRSYNSELVTIVMEDQP